MEFLLFVCHCVSCKPIKIWLKIAPLFSRFVKQDKRRPCCWEYMLFRCCLFLFFINAREITLSIWWPICSCPVSHITYRCCWELILCRCCPFLWSIFQSWEISLSNRWPSCRCPVSHIPNRCCWELMLCRCCHFLWFFIESREISCSIWWPSCSCPVC